VFTSNDVTFGSSGNQDAGAQSPIVLSSSTSTTAFGENQFTFQDYTDTTHIKDFDNYGHWSDSSQKSGLRPVANWLATSTWFGTAAVTEIDLLIPGSSTSFAVGSSCNLVGQ